MSKTRKIKLILLAAVLLPAGLLFGSTAQAAAPVNIAVTFTPNPLFGSVNFTPGDSTKAHIAIQNFSGVAKPIAIEAINVDDPDQFGDALNLEIKEGSNTIFNKSLTDFFRQGETYLSNLANNASTTYELIVTFEPASSNDYQDKVLKNFDIIVGFQGEQTPVTPPGGGSGGGWGSIIPPGLSIFNEASIETGTDSTILTWQTNYLSTSRVIYSSASEPHDFNYGSQPNYGYAHSTIEDPTKVTVHSVGLAGLVPDTLYYYRVISHASPDTVGLSYSFRTAKLASAEVVIDGQNSDNIPVDGDTVASSRINGAGDAASAAAGGNSITSAEAGSADQSGQVLGAEEQNGPPRLGEAGNVAGALEICKKFPNILWIILAIVYLLLLGINHTDKIKKGIREKFGSHLNWSFAALPLIAAALAMILCGVWVWWLWIVMIIFYLFLIIYYFVKIDSSAYWRVSIVITLFMAAIAWIARNCIC